MIYINHNRAIEQLENLVNTNLNKTQSYLPKSFHKEQQHALELLKKRIHLEETIEDTIYLVLIME